MGSPRFQALSKQHSSLKTQQCCSKKQNGSLCHHSATTAVKSVTFPYNPCLLSSAATFPFPKPSQCPFSCPAVEQTTVILVQFFVIYKTVLEHIVTFIHSLSFSIPLIVSGRIKSSSQLSNKHKCPLQAWTRLRSRYYMQISRVLNSLSRNSHVPVSTMHNAEVKLQIRNTQSQIKNNNNKKKQNVTVKNGLFSQIKYLQFVKNNFLPQHF